MSRWFRSYVGMCRDPKIIGVAAECEVGLDRVSFVWQTMLEDACERGAAGKFDVSAKGIAFLLHCKSSEIEAVMSAIEVAGMTKDGVIVAWQKRQYESDSSTERSRKHREAKRNGDATLQERCEASENADATPPDTEAETEKKGRSFAAPADAAEAATPKPLVPLDRVWIEGVPIMTAMGIPERQCRGLVGKWLKAAGDVPITVLDAIQRARDHRVVDPIAWITRNLTEAPRHERSHRNGSLSDAFDSLDARLAGGEGPSHRHRGPELDLAPGDGLQGFAGRFR